MSFLMIPNRKIPAVGKASYGRDFLYLYNSIFYHKTPCYNSIFYHETYLYNSIF